MNQSPHSLAEELVRLSAEYATLSEEEAQIEKRRPFIWDELKKVCKTNRETDIAYDKTDDGQRLIEITRRMKSITNTQSSNKNMLRTMENEARGSY